MLLCLCFFLGDCFKKANGAFMAKRIGMQYGRTASDANIYRLTESVFTRGYVLIILVLSSTYIHMQGWSCLRLGG